MYAGLFDVLHHTGDNHPLAVADRVDVDFRGVFEKPVDQDRLPLRDDKRFADILFELLLVVADLHRPPAQHVARTHEHRVADLVGHVAGLGHVAGDAVGRLLEIQPPQQLT